MRTDLVRSSGSAERDGTVSVELDQGHEFEHNGGSTIEIPLRGSYGPTDIRPGRSGMPQLLSHLPPVWLQRSEYDEEDTVALTRRDAARSKGGNGNAQ